MMKIPTKFLIALSLCLCFTACGQGKNKIQSHYEVAKICYVPIGVDTYAAMTIKNITDHCSYQGSINIYDKGYQEILSLIKISASGSFEDGMIRVKITLPDTTDIYIDENGGVKAAGIQSRIDGADLSKIKKILDHIAGFESR